MCCITCTVLIMYIQDDRLLTKTHPFPGFCLDFLKTFLNIAFERFISALGLAIFRFKLRHLVRETWWCLLTKHISISLFSFAKRLWDSAVLSAHRGGEPGGAQVPPAQGPPRPQGRRVAQERGPHPDWQGEELHHQLNRSVHLQYVDHTRNMKYDYV